jgi:hypothetical protein
MKMSKSVNMNTYKTRVLASALILAFTGLGSSAVQAVEFQKGEWSGSLDTTVSYGGSWRLKDAEPGDFGKAVNNPLTFLLDNAGQRAQVGRWSNNNDDAVINNRNAGDMITHTAKLTSELDLRYGRNFGAFVRFSAFYDFENVGRDELSELADERVGSDVRLLDAYVWGDHALGDRFFTWRLGQQVVSWGESTFIQGGLNVVNPVDVSKLRLAGSELKEAFEGVNMFWGSMGLTDSLSLEGFYLFEWEEIIPDPVGTYFSTNDFATPGGAYAVLGFGVVPQPVNNPDLFGDVCGNFNFGASDVSLPPSLVAAGCSVSLPRLATRKADDGGQFGLALRWFAENLGGTEFGFYYMNYHSRLPLISGQSVVTSPLDPPWFLTTGYWTEYPEDINLYGISFNTTVGTWSMGGEVSYRDNLPLQIDDAEVLFGALTPLNPLLPAPINRYKSQLGQFGPGEYIKGWHEHESWQAQTTLTKVFGPNNPFRANQIAFVTEVGGNYVADLPSWDTLRYNGPGTDTGGGADYLTGDFNNPVTETGGFADDFSWGYRMLARFDYNNAIGAWTLSPRIAWAHDVDGTTPGPGGSFIDGRKTLTVGLGLNLLNEWVVDLAYTTYMGAGSYNLLKNRDFFAASVRYSF